MTPMQANLAPGIEFRDIVKRFGTVTVIPGLNLSVAKGEFVVFVGPSGCGKSTLLRMIAGLEDESEGHITIDGRDVTGLAPVERGIAMVFQSYALYPHLTVRNNIAFGLQIAGLARDEIERRVRQAAETLDLTAYLDRKPAQLSGGQRQRVAIGRAIVREPAVFLFDEPLSNLDASLRVQMRLEITELHQRIGATMVYVTHDQVEAMTMADRIVVFDTGQVQQFGTPTELYRAPANRFVAGFIGSPKMNFLNGEIAARVGAHSIGVRPEHVDLIATGDGIDGRVRIVERLGPETFVYLATDQGELTVRIEGEWDGVQGQSVRAVPRAGFVHRFNAGGQRID